PRAAPPGRRRGRRGPRRARAPPPAGLMCDRRLRPTMAAGASDGDGRNEAVRDGPRRDADRPPLASASPSVGRRLTSGSADRFGAPLPRSDSPSSASPRLLLRTPVAARFARRGAGRRAVNKGANASVDFFNGSEVAAAAAAPVVPARPPAGTMADQSTS